ncbi:MAG: addiction module protein [Nocardiopsaceae bacterium]|jgi:putative addiction module component (TIGR02574 family)|nr:addiction module protein [Nocardiopsaceae bacterium]
MTAAEVIRAAMALSPDEREEVAQTLLESVDGGVDQADVDAAWKGEIARRVDEIRRGDVEGLTREELRAFLNERRAKRGL